MFILYDCPVSNNPESLLSILHIIINVFNIIKIAIPIILILFGTIDLGKAIMAGDEKEIKAATQLLVKRAIAAVAVFLLVTVVMLLTGLVGGTEWKDCWDLAKKTNFTTK